jgi:glycosyltransferase involved in cell wall biosynthesis
MNKVLVLCYTLNPKRGSECGLAHTWLKLISRQFKAVVITDQIHAPDLNMQDYPNAEFHFIRLPQVVRWLGHALAYRYFFWRARPLLARLIAPGDVELIHCLTPNGVHAHNNAYRFGLPVLAGPINGGLPTPQGFNAIFREQFFRNGAREIYYRFFLKTRAWREYFLSCRRIIVSTPEVLRLLPALAVKAAEIVFDVTVDVGLFHPPAAKPASPEVRVLFAGSLESKKGVRLLLEAAKLCRERGVTNFTVEIVGEGSLAKKLKHWIGKNHLDPVIKLLGYLPQVELIRRYQASDIFCFPTLREPGGYVILEAMACGLPVITTNYGGPAYSVTAECGLKINLKDYAAYVRDLAAALTELIQDGEKRRVMGQQARQRAISEFSQPVLEEKILKIYRALLPAAAVQASHQAGFALPAARGEHERFAD